MDIPWKSVMFCPGCGSTETVSTETLSIDPSVDKFTGMFLCRNCGRGWVVFMDDKWNPCFASDATLLAVIFMEGLETFRRKNADYANSWREHGLVGVVIRMHDKLKRLTHLTKKGTEVRISTESISDTLKDLMVYSGMGLVEFFREKILKSFPQSFKRIRPEQHHASLRRH